MNKIFLSIMIIFFVTTGICWAESVLKPNPQTGVLEWVGKEDVLKIDPSTGDLTYSDPNSELKLNLSDSTLKWIDP